MKNRVDDFIKDPKKALFTLAMPVVVATVVQTLYNIVDTAYVGRLGAEALAAMTFSFPLFFILIALNSGITAGMGSRLSRFLGEKKKQEAENTAMHGLFISFVLSIAVFFGGSAILYPMFHLMGAEGSVLAQAVSYTRIILGSYIFMSLAFAFNTVLGSQGDTVTPTRIQIAGLILNAILDPIFIFVFKMGVAGAAVATGIAFFFTLLLSVYYTRKVSYLYVHWTSFKFSPKLVMEIMSVGAPASLMMLLLSFYVVFLNKLMAYFSVNHVAAFGIASRLESVAILPVVAFSVSTLTLVGMFLGARKYNLAKEITWFSIHICVLIASAIGVIFFIFPILFLRIFTGDTTLIQLAAAYLRIDVFTFPLMAVTMTISRSMQGLGHGAPGLVINFVRIFIIALPLAYFFVYKLHLGFLSIAVAMVLGGIAATILALIWQKAKFSGMND